MFTFLATHGVEFGEEVKEGRALVYKVWAHFKHSREHDTADGQKRYAFATDDPKVADRVRAVNDYGITEMTPPPADPAAAPAEPPAPAPAPAAAEPAAPAAETPPAT